MPGSKRRHGDDFDPHFTSTFVFRDPEDVFREFFDGIPFEDLFSGKAYIDTQTYIEPEILAEVYLRNGTSQPLNPAGFHGGCSRRGAANRHNHSTNNSLSTSFFGPFGIGFRLPFDDLLDNAGTTGNFSSFGTFTSFGGSNAGTATKRTSTSTRFMNGKKITTKK